MSDEIHWCETTYHLLLRCCVCAREQRFVRSPPFSSSGANGALRSDARRAGWHLGWFRMWCPAHKGQR